METIRFKDTPKAIKEMLKVRTTAECIISWNEISNQYSGLQRKLTEKILDIKGYHTAIINGRKTFITL